MFPVSIIPSDPFPDDEGAQNVVGSYNFIGFSVFADNLGRPLNLGRGRALSLIAFFAASMSKLSQSMVKDGFF